MGLNNKVILYVFILNFIWTETKGILYLYKRQRSILLI